jgi:hypothetical protein
MIERTVVPDVIFSFLLILDPCSWFSILSFKIMYVILFDMYIMRAFLVTVMHKESFSSEMMNIRI